MSNGIHSYFVVASLLPQQPICGQLSLALHLHLKWINKVFCHGFGISVGVIPSMSQSHIDQPFSIAISSPHLSPLL